MEGVQEFFSFVPAGLKNTQAKAPCDDEKFLHVFSHIQINRRSSTLSR